MFNIFQEKIDLEKYVVVKYCLVSATTLRDAAWQVAIGQSIGNPNKRSQWETDELFENHSCLILHNESELASKKVGVVDIAFPVENIDFETDGIAHLLVNIMGGQLDIDIIEKCQVIDIQFPESVKKCFLGPKFGMTGVREYTKRHGKPLFGGILKPKTGISPSILLDMVKELVDGGVNFIKEDEILSNPKFCRIEDRIPLISEYLKDKNVVYCASIHADPAHILERVKLVYNLGGNGVHVNFWCGLGVYKSIRELDMPIFLHFQKSGDKILTNTGHDFCINWQVICKIAAMSGVDFIHAGMIGGYYKWDEKETLEAVKILNKMNVVPALSCGFHAGLVKSVTEIVGIDYMANVGGAIHSHPDGTKAGALEIRRAIDG